MSSIPTPYNAFDDDDDDDKHSKDHRNVGPEALIILFTFAGLLLGAMLREVSKKSKIPYTPILLAVGLIMGVYVDSLGVLGDATKLALNIEPHGILMIFIPTLIFESAFNADWYIFKKVIINILLLAGPGVLLGTFLLAFVLKVFLGYDSDDLKWSAALTLGSIISTTDPVAVVALLKDLGAHAKFNLLIEGESLLNDGVAMVFFTLFLNIAKGQSSGVGEVVVNFIQLVGGGPLLGFVAGIICSLWLKRITRDNILSITITFIACYLLFFLAETQFHVSGILALVTLGLFMSAYGKTKIDTDAKEALHAVWSWVQYTCETLIFLLTGLLIGYEVFVKESTIEAMDWVKMIFFYIFMIGARAAMVFAFYPLLKRHGYGLTGKEFVVLVWGGLRGALGLALALIVAVDDSLPKRMRDLVLFYMAGMTVMTLLINGTTCSWLVNRLELTAEPAIKNRLQKNLIAEMILKSEEKQDQLMADRFLNLSDWKAVSKLVGNEELIRDFAGNLAGGERTPKDHDPEAQQAVELQELARMIERKSAYEYFKDDDIFQETRFRILRIMKGIFWEKFEQGLLSGEATRLLVEGVNVSLDATEQPIDLWGFFYHYFTSFKLIKFFMKLKDFFLVGKLAKRYITRHMSFIYEVTTAFITVCGEILELDQNIPLSKHHIQSILEEIEKNRSDADNYILDLQGNFLEIIKVIQIQRAANQILDHQKHFLSEMLHSGQIEEKEYAYIRRKIDRRLNSLDNFKIDWHLPTFNEFVVEFPIFSNLSAQDARDIQRESKSANFHKGDFLYEIGNPCNGVFFITKGRVIESIDARRQFSRGVGAILSFANMVNEERTALTNCEAFSDVTVTFVPFEKLDPIVRRNNAFEEKIYKNALYTFLQASNEKESGVLRLDESKLNEVLRKCKLRTLREGEKFRLENGGFLFTGAVTKAVNTDEMERFKAEKYSIIWPTNSELYATKTSKVLEFEEEVRDFFGKHEEYSREERRSYMAPREPKKSSIRTSFRDAFQRDMFDKEFKNMMGKNKNDDYLS